MVDKGENSVKGVEDVSRKLFIFVNYNRHFTCIIN